MLDDIILEVEQRLRLLGGLLRSGRSASFTIIPPTLPIPPVGHTVLAQSSRFELRLERLLSEFLDSDFDSARVRILNRHMLDQLLPNRARLDIKMALTAGFPYTLEHADTLAALIVKLVYPAPAKKGLITTSMTPYGRESLGKTVLKRSLGSRSRASQGHALYQQMLAALAQRGVLIAIASKNDPQLVSAALSRRDSLLDPDSVSDRCELGREIQFGRTDSCVLERRPNRVWFLLMTVKWSLMKCRRDSPISPASSFRTKMRRASSHFSIAFEICLGNLLFCLKINCVLEASAGRNSFALLLNRSRRPIFYRASAA